jgi:hypothetical protein
MKARRMGNGKFVIHYHLNPAAGGGQISDTENWPLGKMDNVKSSPERQVKAPTPF